METIRGKASLDLDFNGLTERLTGYNRIILDLGTGDGKFAFHYARAFPCHFIIGVDSCRENLREHSRMKLVNALFIIARAQDLPYELNGLISHITINFPWGSLLESMLTGDSMLMHRLELISCSAASIDVRLNSGALAEQGWSLEAGAGQIYDNLIRAGWQVKTPVMMSTQALRDFPSTWAKRLAFGRDPRAVSMNGSFK
jgi:16S rRNA (adenine(1408)-N(1))-methyltransferase